MIDDDLPIIRDRSNFKFKPKDKIKHLASKNVAVVLATWLQGESNNVQQIYKDDCYEVTSDVGFNTLIPKKYCEMSFELIK